MFGNSTVKTVLLQPLLARGRLLEGYGGMPGAAFSESVHTKSGGISAKNLLLISS